LIVEKRLVGGVMSDTVHAVGGQCGHVFLRRWPFCIVPGIGGEDDERLSVEISQATPDGPTRTPRKRPRSS
jgi:hypothetical protein